MIKSGGNYDKNTGKFEFISLRSEDMQFLFNNLSLELKDHNYSEIRPGFVSRTLCDKDFQHTINSLHFLIEGGAVLDFGGKRTELAAGDVFVIGNHVKCSWEYTEPSKEITLLFNIYLGNFNDLFGSVSKPLILSGNHESTAYAERLFVDDNCFSTFRFKDLCMEFIEEFLRMSGVDLANHITLAKKYENVFKYITEHLSMKLRIKELAENTNYSTGFFTKSFSRDNGITVKQYVHGKIMSESEQLLIYSDLSLSEISDRFEFCELSYFSRWFKKQKGCSPEQYRKQFRQMYIRPLSVE